MVRCVIRLAIAFAPKYRKRDALWIKKKRHRRKIKEIMRVKRGEKRKSRGVHRSCSYEDDYKYYGSD